MPTAVLALLDADSSSICPNVVDVCLLFVVIKLKNCLLVVLVRDPDS